MVGSEKFFTDDMALRAILDGQFETKEKPKAFDPIYGPTPFKPHTTGDIVALFERQTCARCFSFSHAYLGVFEEKVSESGTSSYKAVDPSTNHPIRKEESVRTIIACWKCL